MTNTGLRPLHLLMHLAPIDRALDTVALPPGCALRICGHGDADGLARVLSEAFGDASWNPARVRSALLDAPDVLTTYAIRCPEIVATASVRYMPDRFPGEGYLHWVATSPAFRGQRLAEAVSVAALREFADRGYVGAWLETDDFRLPAIRLYLRLGFEPVRSTAEFEARWTAVIAELESGEHRGGGAL
ncbi:MAG: GNAT family N-acetyltransferase [Capsulimonadaceae bacterium]|nr:GNAT family N-acetyltransferase [Capsulimonadaceae bacterium]